MCIDKTFEECSSIYERVHIFSDIELHKQIAICIECEENKELINTPGALLVMAHKKHLEGRANKKE